jgi:predicted nuclease of predicted toxin-antitoxin system
VKLLVDMNLSPSWAERLARYGFEAVHWSTIGAATAPDVEFLTWANEHHFVVITNDLDFSAILAASARATPSVVQIRTQDLLSDEVVSTVVHAIEAHRDHIQLREHRSPGRSRRGFAKRGDTPFGLLMRRRR